MKIILQRAITSLTNALDFVGTDELHHGKRVALMAVAIAGEMNWPQARCDRMLYAGMLHDCGVSRTLEHRAITETLEWEGAQQHCLRGADYLAACPPLAHFSEIVRWHHTRWETLLQTELPDDLRLETNLVFLADRTDVLLAPYLIGSTLKKGRADNSWADMDGEAGCYALHPERGFQQKLTAAAPSVAPYQVNCSRLA